MFSLNADVSDDRSYLRKSLMQQYIQKINAYMPDRYGYLSAQKNALPTLDFTFSKLFFSSATWNIEV